MPLKIERNFTVEVEGTKFIFRKPTAKELASLKASTDSLEIIFGGLLRVEGELGYDTEGNALELKAFQEREIPCDVTMQILKAWNEQIALMMKVEVSPEKKDSPTPSNGC